MRLPILSLVFLSLLCVIIAGCAPASPTPTATPVAPTQQPTPTPTLAPLGSYEHPVVLGVVNNNPSTEQTNDADAIAQLLVEKTGFSVQVLFFPTYQELVSEMEVAHVHLAWFPPLTYLWARQKGVADVALVANHFGVYSFGVQFLANANQSFMAFYDPNNGTNLGDAATSLKQFENKRPCWVDYGSVSGYIVPAGILAENNITVSQGVVSQTHIAVIRSLYMTGICDFGVTYATFGDPRTSSEILNDLPDALQRVIIIWRSDAIIPNLNLSFLPDFPTEMRETLVFAFQDIVTDPETKTVLSSLTSYEISDLKAFDDTFYDTLRRLVRSSNADLDALVGK